MNVFKGEDAKNLKKLVLYTSIVKFKKPYGFYQNIVNNMVYSLFEINQDDSFNFSFDDDNISDYFQIDILIMLSLLNINKPFQIHSFLFHLPGFVLNSLEQDYDIQEKIGISNMIVSDFF